MGRRWTPQNRRAIGSIGRPVIGGLVVALVAAIAVSGVGLIIPWLVGRLLDAVSGTTSGESVERIAVTAAGVAVLQAGLVAVRSFASGWAGERAVADVRARMVSAAVRLPMPFFQENAAGSLVSRLSADVVHVRVLFSYLLPQGGSLLVSIVGGLWVMTRISLALVLVASGFVAVLAVLMVGVGRVLRRQSEEFQGRLAASNQIAADAFAAIADVRWFGAEDRIGSQHRAVVDETYGVGMRRVLTRSTLAASTTLLAVGSISVLIWLGGDGVVDQRYSAGELVSFLLYSSMVASSAAGVGGLYAQAQEALGASADVLSVMVEPREAPVRTPGAVVPSGGSVRLINVSFSYPGSGVPILRGVDLELNQGEAVALVGPSGSGKTTLACLIPRFWDADSGCVEVDGLDVRLHDIYDLRSRMAAVSQHVHLFSGTVLDNMRLARPTATWEEVRDALAAIGMSELLSALPEGADTKVGSGGSGVSGGQKQLIAIGRALLADPAILILDEPTSALDPLSEKTVTQSLRNLLANRTALIIAHRLSTALMADRIVVLDGGMVVETGTHHDLLARGGLYSRLAADHLA